MGSLRTIRAESAAESKLWNGGPFLDPRAFLLSNHHAPKTIKIDNKILTDVLEAITCAEKGITYCIPHEPYIHSAVVISLIFLYKIYTMLERIDIVDQIFMPDYTVSLVTYGKGSEVHSVVNTWLKTVPYFAAVKTERIDWHTIKIGERIKLLYVSKLIDLLGEHVFACADYQPETPTTIGSRLISRYKRSYYPVFPLYIKVTT